MPALAEHLASGLQVNVESVAALLNEYTSAGGTSGATPKLPSKGVISKTPAAAPTTGSDFSKMKKGELVDLAVARLSLKKTEAAHLSVDELRVRLGALGSERAELPGPTKIPPVLAKHAKRASTMNVVTIGKYKIDRDTRIAFDESMQAIGRLDEKNKLVAMTDDDIRFLDTNGLTAAPNALVPMEDESEVEVPSKAPPAKGVTHPPSGVSSSKGVAKKAPPEDDESSDEDGPEDGESEDDVPHQPLKIIATPSKAAKPAATPAKTTPAKTKPPPESDDEEVETSVVVKKVPTTAVAAKPTVLPAKATPAKGKPQVSPPESDDEEDEEVLPPTKKVAVKPPATPSASRQAPLSAKSKPPPPESDEEEDVVPHASTKKTIAKAPVQPKTVVAATKPVTKAQAPTKSVKVSSSRRPQVEDEGDADVDDRRKPTPDDDEEELGEDDEVETRAPQALSSDEEKEEVEDEEEEEVEDDEEEEE